MPPDRAAAQSVDAARVVVLAREVPVEQGGWPSAERRLAAELAQAGHRVVLTTSDVRVPDIGVALEAAREAESAIAALAMYVDAAQPFVCLALEGAVTCGPIDAALDDEAVLVVFESLHASLIARGLWHDPNAPEPEPEPEPAPIVPATPSTSVRFGLELLGGVHLVLDDPAPFGLLSLRVWISPLDWLAIAIEIEGSVVPRTFQDVRARASVGIGAARVRAFADIVDDSVVALGPVIGLGVLVAYADASATTPYVGSSAASAAFVVDGGLRATFIVGGGVWIGIEARAFWAPPSFVRFETERVVALGGPGFATELGLGVRI